MDSSDLIQGSLVMSPLFSKQSETLKVPADRIVTCRQQDETEKQIIRKKKKTPWETNGAVRDASTVSKSHTGATFERS